MKKLVKVLLIAILTLIATKISAQQVINFYASEPPYNVLTKADVDAILDAEWDGGEFVAEISPEITVIGESAFFAYHSTDSNLANPINQYLVVVNAPNVKTIEYAAFSSCYGLTKIYFPEVINIGEWAFYSCSNLDSVDLPKVTEVRDYAFLSCYGLSLISFGLGFLEPTKINFGEAVISDGFSMYVDLVLSQYVLPLPNLADREWQSYFVDYPGNEHYVWRSITIKYVGIKEEKPVIFCNMEQNVFYIYSDDIVAKELYDILGRKVKSYNNERIIDLNDLPSSVYFLKCFDSKTTKYIKLIRF
ncbi:MAG: leucine-rich repeat domain-containing protein [Bacteroidetes bacterium]|nr:leucine-rich repeat domain-containing protein [Bacteroidota bacterium]